MENNNEYIVEVRDCLHDLVTRDEFTDANTAYRHYRIMSELYRNQDLVVVSLIEPEY
jgi:hypothetical protein